MVHMVKKYQLLSEKTKLSYKVAVQFSIHSHEARMRVSVAILPC